MADEEGPRPNGEETETGPAEAAEPETDTKPMEAVEPDDDTRPMLAVVPDRFASSLNTVAVILGTILLLSAVTGVGQKEAELPQLSKSDPEPQSALAPFEGEPGGSFRTAGGSVTALSWDPAGVRFAVGRSSGRVEVWDAAKGELRQALDGDGEVVGVAFRVGAQPEDDAEFDEEAAPRELLYSLHGRYRRRGYESCLLTVWDPKTGIRERDMAVPLADVLAASFSSDGRSLAIATEGKLALADLEQMEAVAVRVNYFYPATLAIGGDDSQDILIGEIGASVLLVGAHEDISQRKSFHEANSHTAAALADRGRVAAVGFSAAADGDDQNARSVKFWRDWQRWDDGVQELTGATGDVVSLQFAGAERLFAFCVSFEQMEDRTERRSSLVAWDLKDGKTLGAQALHPNARMCRVSPDGTWAAIGISGGSVELRKVVLTEAGE